MATYNIDAISVGSNTYKIKPDNATQSSDGMMSAEDKVKVDNLEAITSEEISTIFAAI